MPGEVESWLWRKALAAVRRYWAGIPKHRGGTPGQEAMEVVMKGYYRTGWIMGYRAGQKSARRGGAES